LEASSDSANETAPVQEQNPDLYVGASEVEGAESQPAGELTEASDDAQMALPGLEGTVPRSARPREIVAQNSDVAPETVAEEAKPDQSVHS
jgi:hypothetical protein